MNKIKELAKEKTTWVVGVPSIIIGVMSLLDADHGEAVSGVISSAGQQYVSGGDWKSALGWVVAGIAGILMTGRGK